jgi:sirohydrochlorin ferrochelatase
VVPGFASSASPDVPAALARAERDGQTAAVVPFVLFPGVLPDRIREAAAGRQVTPPLGARTEVVDLVVQRVLEAA